MLNFSLKNFYITFFILVIIIFFITSILTIQLSSSNSIYGNSSLDGEFIWPLPEYSYISSYFGKRSSPTAGASSYHSGIDIPAPEGTPIFAVCSGIVTFASWGAGGGYTIVVENNNFSISYCHVSPNFRVSRGDTITAGYLISNVGPKNIYNIINNPYKDSNGNPTNGASTGCHLHLTIKKDGIAVNPLIYFNFSNYN